MIPCSTKRYLFIVKATGLNEVPITAWGFTRNKAELRWMDRYYRWLETRA